MRLPAYTRDGKQCNDCGGAVEYDKAVAMHFHTDGEAVCLPGLEFQRRVLARGEGHLLDEPKEA
jgi:hypothetical protein